MPDTEISRLPELPASSVATEDVLAIVDTSASETKKVLAVSLAQRGIEILPDSSISIDKIDWDGGVTDVIDGSAIADRTISNIKLETNSITEFEIAENAVGSTELKDDAVDTASIVDGAVTDDKIGTNINGNKLLSGSVGSVEIAENAIGSSELSDGAVDTAAIQDSAVIAAKLSPNLDGDAILAAKSVKLAIDDDAITAEKLANNAVTENNIVDAAVTDRKLSGNIDGGKLSNGTVTALAFSASAFSNGIVLNGTVQIDNTVAPNTTNGIQYNAQGLIVGSSALLSTDLPIATTVNVGGVSVPVTGGLNVSGTGALTIDNTVVATTANGITYNSHGLITGSTSIVGSDLPVATNISLGGVIVPLANDNPLLVDNSGNLSFRVSPAGAGTYVNITVDQYGLIQSGSNTLAATQVPPLDASIIASGTFGTPRIGDRAITMQKLADRSISFIQEVQPPLNVEVLHIGCYWYQPSTAQLRIWDGNVFQPVGFGRLAQENLRFGGIVNADTGLVANLTDQGRTAGLVVGQALPAATDALGGLYLVASPGGNNIGVTPGVTYDAGDWCLCINATDGWIRIDTLSGGGGSGGSQYLNDLLDVDINNPQIGDTLIYSDTGNWTNRTTTADRVTISPAFDGATTSFTTSMDILDQNNIMLSVGGVMLEPGVDFNIATGTRQLNFATPPPSGSTYFLINQQTVNTSGGGGGGTDLPPGTAANEYLQWNNNTQSWVPSTELDGGSF